MIKEIPGFAGRYLASDDGRIYSTINRRGNPAPAHQLSERIGSCGYSVVQLRRSRKNENRLVHVVVALTFLGERNGLEVNHKDGNKLNNGLANLEYVTHAENIQHAMRNSLRVHARGERIARSRLRADQIANVRADVAMVRANGRAKNGAMKMLSDKYGVSPQALDHVARGDSWKHIPYPGEAT